MAVDATIVFTATPQETLTGADGATSPQISFDAFNTQVRLSATSTPPITKVICKTISLTAGAYTIDLTTETGTNGVAIAATGLKVQFIRVKNLGANTMTFSEGASNGYALRGSSWTQPVYTGGSWMEFFNDATPDVASGDRTIAVAGTTTQQFQLTILLG